MFYFCGQEVSVNNTDMYNGGIRHKVFSITHLVRRSWWATTKKLIQLNLNCSCLISSQQCQNYIDDENHQSVI